MKNKQNGSGLNYRQQKKLATSAPMQRRAPANFDSRGNHTGMYSPQAEQQRAQAKNLRRMHKGLKATVNELDITGAQKSRIFDQIQPKQNGPQRTNKLGY